MSDARNGKDRRLVRLSRYGDGRYLFIPLDHSVSDGPIVPHRRFVPLVGELVAGGADAIIVHKGRAAVIPPALLAGCSLIVHLSASTSQAEDTHAKVLVADVEDAVRLGADAVSVHVNIGSATEPAQLADLGAVATSCASWGVPLLAMIYPRGGRYRAPHEPATLSHVVSVATDLGADLVKTDCTLPPERMAEVVADSSIPVLVAGGGSQQTPLAPFARAAMAAGCRGLAIGRRVFRHPRPFEAVRELSTAVHGLAPPARPLSPGAAERPLAGSL